MRLKRLSWACLLVACPLVGLAQSNLYEWTFDQANGTSLSKTNAWSEDFNDSATDGNGRFIVKRTPNDVSNAFVKLDVPIDASKLPGRVWLVVEFAGWKFSGKTASETMRIGFAEKKDDKRPSITAQIRLERTDANKVVIAGEAFGDDASKTKEVAAFTANQLEPVTLVLELDKQKDSFEVYYQLPDGPFVSIGSGKIDPERLGRYLRLGFSGHFGAEGELLGIERIAVTEYNPMR